MSHAVGDALIEIDDARLGPPSHPCPSRLFELTRLHADQRGFAYIQITLPMDVPYADNYPVIIHLVSIVTTLVARTLLKTVLGSTQKIIGTLNMNALNLIAYDTIVAPLCWDRTAFARMLVIFIMHTARAMSILPCFL